MATTKEVTVSGAVGKQVFATTQQVCLKSVIVDAAVSATFVIRDGNASGDVKLKGRVDAGLTDQFALDDLIFSKGMHFKLTGTGNTAYLVIE